MGNLKYLLDTHTLLWAIRKPNKLGKSAMDILSDERVHFELKTKNQTPVFIGYPRFPIKIIVYHIAPLAGIDELALQPLQYRFICALRQQGF